MNIKKFLNDLRKRFVRWLLTGVGNEALLSASSIEKLETGTYIVDFGQQKAIVVYDALDPIDAIKTAINNHKINIPYPSQTKPWFVYAGGSCLLKINSLESVQDILGISISVHKKE